MIELGDFQAHFEQRNLNSVTEKFKDLSTLESKVLDFET